MTQMRAPRRLLAACVAITACAAASLAPAGARAADGACPSTVEAPYGMHLTALTGPQGADLTVAVEVDAASQCAPVDVLKKVQLKTYGADGSLAATRNVTDVAAPGGVATIALGQVPRDRRVEADVLVQTGTPARTFVVRGEARTLLRPDLVVVSVEPKQALAGEPFRVAVVVAERNADVGATAEVSLSAIPGSAEQVVVPEGGTATATFENVRFDEPVPVAVTATALHAVPAETSSDNNALGATIDVTRSRLAMPRVVLFPSLGGYGAQFNGHLYAPISTQPPSNPPIPPGELPGVVEKMRLLQPQLVRIFYNDNWEENADGTHANDFQANYDSLVQVVRLAQDAGATIDISYQNLSHFVAGDKRPRTPEEAMHKYADALEDLVVGHDLTNVRWADIGNEPNAGAVTQEQLTALYRALDSELVARGLHGQIHLMGPGLVENGANQARDHYAWLSWIASDLGSIVDAYAEHVYWFYSDPGRLEYRLRDTYHLLSTLPADQQKPMYMMEYGIRGDATCGAKPKFSNLYYGADPGCPEIWRTNIAGFQQFWFDVDAAQLAVAGTSKWDAYWAVYDRNSVNQQLYWLTGPPSEHYPLTPSYNALSLLFHVTVPGWQIVRVEPWDESDWSVPTWRQNLGDTTNDQPEQELAAYVGSAGEITVVGLDTRGKDLNGVSTEPPSAYSIGGLPPNAEFSLAVWNATGDGTNAIAGKVVTNAAGVARFEVPLQAAFALTNVPVA